eukprot:scaffold2340_cov64-Cyclotella_meneghiniana.AAC.4
MKSFLLSILLSILYNTSTVNAFSSPSLRPIQRHHAHTTTSSSLQSSSNNNEEQANEEAARLRQKAAQLRDQVSRLESMMDGTNRRPNNDPSQQQQQQQLNNDDSIGKTLRNKRILITGANGRLGSMITRHLLRSRGSEMKEVIAAVHYVGSSATTRGYGRLSYEVGAEDGIGSIGPAWSGEDERNASFQYDDEVMKGYNLHKLRVVDVELLNPLQVQTITENVDAIIYCATDFEGNRPKAVASLNAALLFRAVADPLKGRVEIEGVRNCLEGLVKGRNDRRYKDNLNGVNNNANTNNDNGPTQFILISSTPDAFTEYETPFGEFNGLKRQSEYIVTNEFPSVSYSVLQMGRYDEGIEEDLEIYHEEAVEDTAVVDGVIGTNGNGGSSENTKRKSIWDDQVKKRRINRRDAARAAVEALLDDDLMNRKVQCYTVRR